MKKILQVILLILILPLTSKAEENNKYKPEDFEGIWITTGIVQYGNKAPYTDLDYFDYIKYPYGRIEGFTSIAIDNYRYNITKIIIEDENQPEENISGYHFGMLIQDNIRGLYYINAWYDDAKPYWYNSPPLIKLIKKDNKMYLKYDLCYDTKCEDNRGGVLL